MSTMGMSGSSDVRRQLEETKAALTVIQAYLESVIQFVDEIDFIPAKSDAVRKGILERLRQEGRAMPVHEIAEPLGVSSQRAYYHLNYLVDVGLVEKKLHGVYKAL